MPGWMMLARCALPSRHANRRQLPLVPIRCSSAGAHSEALHRRQDQAHAWCVYMGTLLLRRRRLRLLWLGSPATRLEFPCRLPEIRSARVCAGMVPSIDSLQVGQGGVVKAKDGRSVGAYR